MGPNTPSLHIEIVLKCYANGRAETFCAHIEVPSAIHQLPANMQIDGARRAAAFRPSIVICTRHTGTHN